MNIRPDTVWRHRNGTLYTILHVANTTNTEKYPLTVVYQGENGRVWARELRDWMRSMSPVNKEEGVVKTCYDLKKLGAKYNCCDSCHEEDEEYGYEMSYREVNGVDYHVCCKAPKEHEEVK